MRKKIIFSISVIFAVICMIVIFRFSSQNCADTNSVSYGVTSKLASIIFSEYDQLNAENQNLLTEQLNHFVRKMAHFSLYFILGFMTSLSVFLAVHKYIKSFAAGVTVCFIYGSLDEIHQIYVPGRTPLVRDVIIDTAGGVCGILFFFMMISVILNIKRVYTEKKTASQ